MALLPKACSYRGALLLHHRPLVGNGLRGSHIANELFNCRPVWSVTLPCPSSLRFGSYESSLCQPRGRQTINFGFCLVVGSVACNHRIRRIGGSKGRVRMVSSCGFGYLGLLSLLHKLPSDEARLHAPRSKLCANPNHVMRRLSAVKCTRLQQRYSRLTPTVEVDDNARRRVA